MRRVLRKTGFQQRVVGSILAIGVISVLAGLMSVYFFGRAALTDSIGTTYQKLAEVTATNLAKEVDHHIDEARALSITHEIVRVVSESNSIYSGSSKEEIAQQMASVEKRWANDEGVDAYLHALLTNSGTAFLQSFGEHDDDSATPSHLQIMATDRYGAVVAATKKPGHYDFSSQEWWRAVMESGKPFLSGIEQSDTENTYTFSVAHPIFRDGGKPIGVLHMVHNAPRFFRTVTDVRVGTTDHTMLVDSNGTILFCPVLPIKSHHLDEQLQPKVLHDSAGWVSTRLDIHHPGKKSITGFAPVTAPLNASPAGFGGERWYIVTSQNPKEAFSPVFGLLKWVALTGILGSLVIAALGFVAARRIIRPIHILREGVELVASGNLDHTIKVKSNDEIEDLATAFNEMSEKLQASYSGLEAKISERTRELEAKNRELFALYAIVSTLSQTHNTREGFLDALNKIMVTLQVDAIALTVFKGTSGILASYTAPKGSLEEKAIKTALGTLENHVKSTGRPHIAADLHTDEKFSDLAKELGYTGIASIPVEVKGHIIGVLHLLDRGERIFSGTERTLINSIVTQLGASIDSARLPKQPA